MKYLPLLFFILTFPLQAQDMGTEKGELFLKLSLQDDKPLARSPIWLIEKQSGTRQDATTSNEGKVRFPIVLGNTYYLKINEQDTLEVIPIPNGSRRTFVMNLKCNPIQLPGPASVSIPGQKVKDTIHQENSTNASPGKREALVVIGFMKSGREKIIKKGLDVYVTDSSLAKVYHARTDKDGKARLLLPTARKYIVGAGNTAFIDRMELPLADNLIAKLDFTYVQAEVHEVWQNDTIRQSFPVPPCPATDRVYIHFSLLDHNNTPLPGEKVCFHRLGTDTVYAAVTNSKGLVELLLPKGSDYIISLKYAANLQRLSVPLSNSLRRSTFTINYTGSRHIEEFYAKAGRDPNGFQIEFMESKAERITSPEITVKHTSLGYNVLFKDGSSPASAPAVISGTLYLSNGYYANHIYALDAEDGTIKWGMELQENGASPAVYENGVILVNTESCTLYALDANTGKLLWSKWLSPYLLTTPSAAAGRVYAIYGNQLSKPARQDNTFVLACFDLRTGHIEWQQRLNAEGIGAPVIHDGKVYLSTYDGRLQVWEAASGKLLAGKDMGAASAPLIVKNKLYLSYLKDKNYKAEVMGIFDANSLQLQKDITNLSGICLMANKDAELHPCDAMNYTGSRMISSQGRNYNIMGARLNGMDMDGKLLWQNQISSNDSTFRHMPSPAIAGNYIITAGKDGNMALFNSQSGRLHKQYDTGTPLWNQVVAHKGWIYALSYAGSIIAVNTKDASITGWGMWGGNASHNPVR